MLDREPPTNADGSLRRPALPFNVKVRRTIELFGELIVRRIARLDTEQIAERSPFAKCRGR